MADTYTSLSRALLIEQYSRDNTWGPDLNSALSKLDGMWRAIEVTVNGNVTLTSENVLTDQASAFVLILSGAGGFTVTVPALPKPYFVVNNCSANVTVSPLGGSGATVRAGNAAYWYSNGTDGFVSDPTLDNIQSPEAAVDMNGHKITDLADATDEGDALSLGRLRDFVPGTITISTSTPTGGSDGDLWFRVLP